MEIYQKRIRRYHKLDYLIIPNIKNTKHLSREEIKQKEGLLILSKVQASDNLILLDEQGKEFSSAQFSAFLNRQFVHTQSRLIFLVGGAYGFSEAIYQRANHSISLSKMTFSHQMVRLFFLEQFYRAMTILNNEPYHNQ